MSITTLPVVADFGGTKADEYAEVDSSKQLAAAAYNALTGRMVDAFTAIGLDDGSTPGSLREGLQTTQTQVTALERPYSDTRTHTETSAAYTWSSGLTIKRLVIDRTGSKCAVTLDESDWEDGTTCRLDVLDTDGLGITIALANALNTLNGQAAGVGYTTLPGSDLVGGMPASYEVTRADGGVWTIRPMVDFGPRLDDIESVLGPLSSTTVPALDTRIDALEVTGRQVITTSTATILPGTRVVYIDHAAARTDLTLPATPFEPFTIVKRATSGGFGVRLIPDDAADAIQGLAAGTNFDIGWMTTNASTTTARPAAFVSSSVVNVVDVA